MSTTFYNTFSITISYSKNFGAYLCTGKPNQFPMAPPAGSDSGLRPPQGQSRFLKGVLSPLYSQYSHRPNLFMCPLNWRLHICW